MTTKTTLENLADIRLNLINFAVEIAKIPYRTPDGILETPKPDVVKIALELERYVFQTVSIDDAMEIIDDYLNSSGKQDRKDISTKAKKLYREFHGKEYINRNLRG